VAQKLYMKLVTLKSWRSNVDCKYRLCI